MNKTTKSQESYNEALIDMMCVTFSKKQMKQLLEVYIKSNKLTEDILAFKEDLNNSSIRKQEHIEKLNKIKTEFKEVNK